VEEEPELEEGPDPASAMALAMICSMASLLGGWGYCMVAGDKGEVGESTSAVPVSSLRLFLSLLSLLLPVELVWSRWSEMEGRPPGGGSSIMVDGRRSTR
jgi:hypothetical protein